MQVWFYGLNMFSETVTAFLKSHTGRAKNNKIISVFMHKNGNNG